MTEHINRYFKSQFLNSFRLFFGFYALLIILSVLRPQLMYALGWGEYPSYSWTLLQSMAMSLSFGSLVALSLPWVQFHYQKEWLYTRSLDAMEIFRFAFRVYFKWWLGLGLFLAGVAWWSQHYYRSSGYDLSWSYYLIFMAVSLYFALYFASPPSLFIKQSLPFGLLLVWGVLNAVLPSHPIGMGLFWGLLLGAPLWSYKTILQSSEPGKQPQFLQLIEFLNLSVGQAQSRFPRLALMTAPLKMVYLRLLLLLVLGGVLPALWLTLPQGEPIAIQAVKNNLIFYPTCVVGMLILAFVSPRWLLKTYRELFQTRPLSMGQLYLANWFLQGVFIFVIGLMAWIKMMAFSHNGDLNIQLNLSLCLMVLFCIWVGGELVGGLLLVSLGLSYNMALWTGVMVILNTPNIWLCCFVFCLMAFRLVDFELFRRETWERKWLRSALWRYALPGCFTLVVMVLSFYQHPLLQYVFFKTRITLYASDRDTMRSQISDTLFFPGLEAVKDETLKRAGVFQQIPLENLMNDPQSDMAKIEMGLSLIEDLGYSSQELHGLFTDIYQEKYFKKPFIRYYPLNPGDFDANMMDFTQQVGDFWLAVSPTAPASQRLRLAALVKEYNVRYEQALTLAQQAFEAAQTPTEDFANAYTLGRLQRKTFRYQQAMNTYQTLTNKQPQYKGLAEYLQAMTALEFEDYPQAQALLLAIDLSQAELPIRFEKRLLDAIESALIYLPYASADFCQGIEKLYTHLAPSESAQKSLASTLKSIHPTCFSSHQAKSWRWLAEHGQAEKALTLLRQNRKKPAWQADLLRQLGQPKKAKEQALKSIRSDFISVHSASIRLESAWRTDQVPAFRALIEIGEISPQIIQGYILHHPQSDSGYIHKARPKEQSELRALVMALDKLYDYFETRGGIRHGLNRNFELTRVLLSLAQKDAQATAELKTHFSYLNRVEALVRYFHD